MMKRFTGIAVLLALTAPCPGYAQVEDLTDQDTSAIRSSDQQCSSRGDGALDPESPNARAQSARERRRDAADLEFSGTRQICQDISTDTDLAAKFHKTLPHNSLGQVDPAAFQALEECIFSGDFDTCELVPSGDPDGFLVNPVAGFAIDMAGPASTSGTTPAAPTLDSAELAAQLAEAYWMALTRDVPFFEYGDDPTTITAAANLVAMEGFEMGFGTAINSDGTLDPFSQLYRLNFVGVETGPMVSQLLLKDFTLDSITVSARQTTPEAGVDFMTDYDDWLFIQNGGSSTEAIAIDPVDRYIRNARDLARMVLTDTILTEAFRGALILLDEGAISRAGFNGPYMESERQAGFVNFGTSHVMKLLGGGEGSQRLSWYQKWQVHLFPRPEALAGTVHNTLNGELSSPIHESLLENNELLDKVWALNQEQNANGEGTHLLSQAGRDGSPAHPSYPAGHAVQNGAFATLLKAIVGLERGEWCFDDPVFPDFNGLELLAYTGGCLTFEGEINKLASNVATGRQMSGIHYKFDSTRGLILGETYSVRLLHQELMSFTENFTYEFRLFSGNVIKLYPDGGFSIDGNTCNGDVYTGVEDCYF